VPFDGAPSRGGPGGGRWMAAIIEAPGPDASLQFYVRGPRPDINDEWGSTSRRGGGGSRPNGRGSTGAQRWAACTRPWPGVLAFSHRER
jgi:hypothetical protein